MKQISATSYKSWLPHGMAEHAFSLIPFPAPDLPDISITGTISLEQKILALHYAVAGNMEEVTLPAVSTSPRRKDDLWKATCFEFFFALVDEPPYWEFNFSLTGDWNAYRMEAYRRTGFREESSVQWAEIVTRKDTQNRAGTITLSASVDLGTLLPDGAVIQAGITAVIQTKHGDETYWALAHPAPQADFHVRESFILRLADQTHPVRQAARGG